MTPNPNTNPKEARVKPSQRARQKTAVAFIVVVLLGAYAIWDGTRFKNAELKKQQDLLVIPYKVGEITAIELQNANAHIVLQRIEKKPADPSPSASPAATPASAISTDWVMLEPLKDQVDSIALLTFLQTLTGEKIRETVAEPGAESTSDGKSANPIQWSVFGLEHPVTTLKLTARSNDAAGRPVGEPTTELIEIGSVKAYDSNLYARVNHQNRVLLVGSDWDVYLTKLPREFRDKRLLRDRDDSKLNRLEIDAKGVALEKVAASEKSAEAIASPSASEHLIFEAKDGKWSLAGGAPFEMSEPISDTAVRDFVEQIKSARALDFLDEDKTAPGVLQKENLTSPALTLRLSAPGETPIVLQFASPVGAKTKTRSVAPVADKAAVAAVSSEIKPVISVYSKFLETLRKPVSDFFDKQAAFHFPIADVARVSLHLQDKLTKKPLDLDLVKQGQKWVVATPGIRKDVDSAKFDQVLQAIGQLQASRFVQPLSSARGSGHDSSLEKMKNRIELKSPADHSIFVLQWGDLLFEKKNSENPEAQFVATMTSRSKWLLGVAEGSLQDLKLNEAIKDVVSQNQSQVSSPTPGSILGSPSGSILGSPSGSILGSPSGSTPGSTPTSTPGPAAGHQ